jgi:TonB-dependent receptor
MNASLLPANTPLRRCRRAALYAAVLLGTALATTAYIPTALAQANTDQDDEMVLEEVIVTGYRRSLMDSTAAKRDSVGFTDEIFADDIGKLPSQNLAESLNRIPGVKISRDVTGEGQQISVRGLGPSFTKIVLNGNNIAVASDGNLTGTNSNREVDLDIFPPELFSSLAVSKTPMADQVEGGTSGYVNLRTRRPFDDVGQQVTFSAEGIYTDINNEVSPRVTGLYSNTFNDRFGFLVAGVVTKRDYRVDGYETIGFSDGCIVDWTNPEQTSSNCDSSGSWQGLNHFRYTPYATADYVAAHPELGLSVGDRIDPLATSGLSRDALDRGIIPYLGRGMYTVGDRDGASALLSLQYQFSDDMDFAFDVLYAETDRDFDRVEAMNWGRRNFLSLDAAWIPENLTVDSNQTVTGGTLYNTHVWVGQRAYVEDFDFTSFMPSFRWDINDQWRTELSASYTESSFFRDEPYFLFLTPGTPVNFSGLGDVPTFDYGLDIASPDIGWVWNDIQGDQIRMQRNYRDTETKGFHADFVWESERAELFDVRFGLAWDEASRDLTFYGGSNNTALKEGHLFPSDAYANIGNYLIQSPVGDLGDVFDNSVGYNGIAMLDVARFYDSIDYYGFIPTESGTGDQFGQGVGNINEEILGLYVETNLAWELFGRPARANVGVRWVDTDQKLYSIGGGGTETSANYDEFLPSANLTWDVTEPLKLRLSASQTMTRANPGEMYPNSVWTSSGIDTARAGNPNLEPFKADNFDIGGEYYFGEMGGYISLAYFWKDITGFTRNDVVDVLFQELDAYGLDTSDISESQQDALNACGGPSVCTVRLSTRTNVEGAAELTGWEMIWVQPLDMLVEGMGFNASATTIDQSADDPASIITGISDWTYNWTGYYENERFQFRLTYFYQDGSINSGFQGYDGSNGFPARRIRSDDRSQMDFSAAYLLPWFEDLNLSLTFDGYNVTNEPVRNLFEHPDLTYDIFYPGATYTFGIRGQF